MSYNLSKQTRSWQVRFILDLVYAFVTRKLWDPATVIVIHKGKTGPGNMTDAVKAAFEEGKIYDLAGKKVTAGEIIAKAEAFDAKNAKSKFPVVVEGRHRVVGLWLAAEFHGVQIEAAEAEVGDEMAAKIGLEANLTNEQYAKLLNTEKLGGIVEAVRSGVYKKQTDLPVKRGQQQALWHRAQAVIVQGIPLDKAVKLSYKEAAQVTEGKADVDAVLAARAGNAAKVLPGEKIRDLVKMCQTYDPKAASVVAKLINAIAENAETTAKTLIVDFFKSGNKA